jgi:predicted AlkP superfamily pyrophosphatase or phosphodiesterase
MRDLEQFCCMTFLKSIICIIAIVMFANWASAQKKVVSIHAKPKLVVGLVIDQMRYDYLQRYITKMGNNGFKKIIANGYDFANTNLNYIPSVTGCGHASIYTGSVPALNGIASNDWYDQLQKKTVYCVQDDSVQSVGAAGRVGKMSPKNMWASTIGDELQLAQNFKGQVVGIALKDRGAILPAGHSANAAYWMDDSVGNFITSTYYMKELPTWVQSFNGQGKARQYLSKDWNTTYPIESYLASSNDDNLFEGKFKWEQSTAFPHTISKFTKAADIKKTPFGNSITLDFALAAIENMKLGKGPATDLLAVSLSSTDYVGHQFGINAIELEDTYYKLDQDIAFFLSELDKQIGEGNYLLFISADHGAAHNPTYLNSKKINAGFLMAGMEKKRINEAGKVKYGCNIIIDMGDNQIWINDSVPNKTDAISDILADVKKWPSVHYALPSSQIMTSNIPQPIREAMINGYTTNRSGDIILLLKPAFIESYNNLTTGTTHGTWNPYDSHIPFLLYGHGIKRGKSFESVHVTDIAATLCALLNIQVPNACIGEARLNFMFK